MLLLAWLFAFLLSPVVSFLQRVVPHLPRTAAVVIAYGSLFIALVAVVLVLVASLAQSVGGFVTDLPDLQERAAKVLAEWQGRLASFGITTDLTKLGEDLLAGLGTLGQPIAGLALASLGIIGNLLLVVFLSLFVVIDKDRIVAFLNRLVPPRYADEARLFETSVATAFGGFLRGQAIQGIVYGAFAAFGSLYFGLNYAAATTALVAILQMIPFFGPFLSWAPPVVVAVLQPDANVPGIFIVMAVGWFITMNIVQPRVMAQTVGIHPVAVLVSVLIGLKLQGVIGAIFAIPVAAVISTFFFYYLNRTAGGPRDVTSRAARRVEEREGRRVRVPTPPSVPGPAAPEVVAASAAAGTATAGRLGGATPPRVPPPDETP
jgi:predicted PurR-regulated permease PerM